MNYISFDGYYSRNPDHWKRTAWINKVIDWLKENAGEEEIYWIWNRGDLLAQGVTIFDEEVAILFKLKFEV